MSISIDQHCQHLLQQVLGVYNRDTRKRFCQNELLGLKMLSSLLCFFSSPEMAIAVHW